MGGGHNGCQPKIEVIVKMQKSQGGHKKVCVWGGGGVGWMGTDDV